MIVSGAESLKLQLKSTKHNLSQLQVQFSTTNKEKLICEGDLDAEKGKVATRDAEIKQLKEDKQQEKWVKKLVSILVKKMFLRSCSFRNCSKNL